MMSFAAAGIAAPTLGGWLAGRYGFALVLAVGIGLELAIAVVLGTGLRELRAPRLLAPIHLREWLAVLGRTLVPVRRLRSFYLAATVDVFAFGIGAGILPGMLSKTFRFTPLQLGIMGSISSVVWTVSQMFFARLVDRLGSVRILVMSELIGVLWTGGCLISSDFGVFAALEVLGGMIPATWAPAYLAWIAKNVPEHQRGEEMGRLAAFRGLWGFAAPSIGGLLFDKYGIRVPILINMVGCAVAAAMICLFVRDEAQGEEAVSQQSTG
jgi:MFS family permease